MKQNSKAPAKAAVESDDEEDSDDEDEDEDEEEEPSKVAVVKGIHLPALIFQQQSGQISL